MLSQFRAIKELADRIDGKVPQAQIIQGDDDGGRVRYFAEMPKPCSSTEEWVRDVEEYLAAKANRSESSH